MKTFKPGLISNLVSGFDKSQDSEENDYVWTTEKVNEAVELKTKKNLRHPLGDPFLAENFNQMRRGGVTFQLTPEERTEFVKCAGDLYYFAETYCKIKTEEGQYTHFELRPYQREFFQKYLESGNVIYVASRQIGKCLSPITDVDIIDTQGNTHTIPMMELKNIVGVKTTISEQIKKWLWKIYKTL